MLTGKNDFMTKNDSKKITKTVTLFFLVKTSVRKPESSKKNCYEVHFDLRALSLSLRARDTFSWWNNKLEGRNDVTGKF